MAQGKKSSERLEPLNLRIPKALKIRFKSWCALHETDMTDVIVKHIRSLLSDPPPKATKPRGSPVPKADPPKKRRG